ncbi:MAG: hypothetical protein M3179_04470 [Actinomycetota bacterium]|nr:hypothetical protein [Actinomycetota bacterium]
MDLTARVDVDLLTTGQQDVTANSGRGILLKGGHGSMGTTCCSATFLTESTKR